MKIIYIGNFRPDHSTENHYARSLEALGAEVIRQQEDEQPTVDPVLDGPVGLLLYTRTWDSPWWGPVLDYCASAGIPTVAVHLDRWRGLARAAEIEAQSMFRVDHLFQPDGDALGWFAERGVTAHWLRPGVLADECYDADPDPEWAQRWDVAFVGSAPDVNGGNYHEEWPHRAELVEHLRGWYGDRFVHVGNGGELGNNTDRPNLRGDDLNRLYASVPVVVGDSCLVERDGRYWSDRVYETWGRGGFLIHPQVDALEAELGAYPGGDWEPGDWPALHHTIDHYLADTEARHRARLEIGGFVGENCTYTNRAKEMLDVLGLS